MDGGSVAEGTERVAPDPGPGEPHLLIVAADGTWTTRALPATGTLTIGRDDEADLRIDERAVSRQHARLTIRGDTLELVDLGSANGTRIGGELVRGGAAIIRPGVPILIGRTVLALHVPAATAPSAPPVVARSAALATVDALVAKAAPTLINVLLLGETGVGKDVVAERIHRASTRARGPFVRLNCAALSGALLESEVFGHERGAFTGADQAKAGLLEAASGGTVFLDEIGEMPVDVQAKLLVAIEQRVARRVGATRTTAIDVRFISATHRDLEAAIAAGRFRADFFYRINGLTIQIPPLRERRDEIDGLVEQFTRDAITRLGRDDVPRITAEARAALHAYDWPGNVRELRAVVERAVLLADRDVITHDVLVTSGVGGDAPVPVSPVDDGDLERDRVIAALAECGGNQSRAARMLGVARNTLIARIRKYGLVRPHEREPA